MPDDDENEDSSSKSDTHEDDEELSILEKIASMHDDQYNEASKGRNKEIVESVSNTTFTIARIIMFCAYNFINTLKFESNLEIFIF